MRHVLNQIKTFDDWDIRQKLAQSSKVLIWFILRLCYRIIENNALTSFDIIYEKREIARLIPADLFLLLLFIDDIFTLN